MICDFPKWWSILTYDGFKSHVNVTDALGNFAEERIKVSKEEAGTSAFNQAYDKFQVNQDKAQTRNLLDFARRKIYGQKNQLQIIMIISISIQNIPTKLWTDSIVVVNLYPNNIMTFPD